MLLLIIRRRVIFLSSIIGTIVTTTHEFSFHVEVRKGRSHAGLNSCHHQIKVHVHVVIHTYSSNNLQLPSHRHWNRSYLVSAPPSSIITRNSARISARWCNVLRKRNMRPDLSIVEQRGDVWGNACTWVVRIRTERKRSKRRNEARAREYLAAGGV